MALFFCCCCCFWGFFGVVCLFGFVFLVFLVFFFFLVFKTGFRCSFLEPVLELALVDQVGLELTEICLPLPPQCWD